MIINTKNKGTLVWSIFFGQIVLENIPTNTKTILNIPNNLVLIIKVERIKELENLMKN